MITRRSQFGPTLRRLGRSRYLWISNFDPVLERFRKLRINMELTVLLPLAAALSPRL